MRNLFSLAAFAALLFISCSGQKPRIIASGEIWPDDKGVHINAHGGGILFYNGKYYWFGENKGDTTSLAMVGVDCYSSKDLVNWKNEGVALAVSDDPSSPITKGSVVERPKVIYNEKTKKFVMWFHNEIKGHGYDAAHAAVAVSDRPAGPYELLRSSRVNAGFMPLGEYSDEDIAMWDNFSMAPYDTIKNLQDETWFTPQWKEEVTNGLLCKRDMVDGQMARDMTLFVDTDGKAYHIFASEENLTLDIAELTDDYLGHTGRFVRVAPLGHNEAPSIFKKDGKYWMITSGCTGWAPNAARLYSAENIFGPWTYHGNPCRGEGADITYGSQSTYILPYNGQFIFMADLWRPEHPSDARYLWLPIQFDEAGTPYLEYIAKWDLDTFKPVEEEEKK